LKTEDQAAPRKASKGREALRRLRGMVLTMKEGAFLGSEQDLADLLQISRPTVRQVLRALEQEQNVTVQRGGNGGYFVRRPSVSSVAFSAACYLFRSEMTLGDLFEAIVLLDEHLIPRAARSENMAARLALSAFAKRLRRKSDKPQTVQETHRDEREYTAHLVELSGNAALGLFREILQRYALDLTVASIFDRREEWMRVHRQQRLGLVEAILNGDPDGAMRVFQESQGHYSRLVPQSIWTRRMRLVDTLEEGEAAVS
jgi:DNA-binding FadR family transcriptional regulator